VRNAQLIVVYGNVCHVGRFTNWNDERGGYYLHNQLLKGAVPLIIILYGRQRPFNFGKILSLQAQAALPARGHSGPRWKYIRKKLENELY
jgi:hypothetical protein